MKNNDRLLVRLPKKAKELIKTKAQEEKISISAFVRNKIFRTYVEVNK